jgi:hypothetical protein
MPSCPKSFNPGARLPQLRCKNSRRSATSTTRCSPFASGVPLYRGGVVRAAIAMLRSAHDRRTAAHRAVCIFGREWNGDERAKENVESVDCASCSRRAGCVLLNGSRGDGPGVFLSATKKVVEANPSIASTPTHRSDRDARCAHSDVTDIEYEYRHRRRRDCISIHDGCAA